MLTSVKEMRWQHSSHDDQAVGWMQKRTLSIRLLGYLGVHFTLRQRIPRQDWSYRRIPLCCAGRTMKICDSVRAPLQLSHEYVSTTQFCCSRRSPSASLVKQDCTMEFFASSWALLAWSHEYFFCSRQRSTSLLRMPHRRVATLSPPGCSPVDVGEDHETAFQGRVRCSHLSLYPCLAVLWF